LTTVKRIVEHSGLHVQLGGGIRDDACLGAALEIVDRVVIGSLAITRPELVARWLEQQGGSRIGLALDVRLDSAHVPYVATHAWRKTSRQTLWKMLERYRACGLLHVLCTDVDRDGALEGPNLTLYRTCVERAPGLAWQASGGVRDAADLAALAEI